MTVTDDDAIDDLMAEIKELRSKVEDLAGELEGERDALRASEAELDDARQEIDRLEGEVEELTPNPDEIRILITSRKMLREGELRAALDELTRYLDRNVECWRVLHI